MSRSKNCLTKIGFPIVSDNRDTLKSLKRVMSRRSSRVIESQLKQIDAIFRAHSADPPHVVTLELKKDKNCDVHGLSLTRRGSMDSTKNLSRKGSTASSVEGKRNSFCSTEKLNENFRKKNRNSIASFTELVERSVTPNGNGFSRGAVEREVFNRPRRESMPIIDNVKTSNGKKSPLHENWNNRLFKGMEHPSNFPNMLRTSSQSLNGKNNGGDRRSSSSWNVNHFHNYNGNSNLDKKQSLSTSEKIFKRDYANGSSSGSSPEPKKELHSILKNKKHDEDDLKEIIKRLSFDYIEKEMSQNGNNKMEVDLLSNSDSSSGGNGRRTPITTFKNMPRRISVDSLDSRRGSRRFSDFTDDDDIVTLRNRFNSNSSQVQPSDANRPRFVAVTSLEDVQAVRCAEFHPNGTVYAIGSNSKTFRICEYPSLADIREEHSTYQATVLFKRTKHHKGSIYCMAWSPQGDLIATGSNDKTVKLMRYNDDQKQLEGREIELTMHDGTVRDLCFLEDSSNKSSLLISGGAGDCKIYITDCATSTPYQALSGHGSHILSLYNWGGAMFVSGSQDKSVRFWDLRTRGCVNMVTPATSPNSRQGSPVAAVCVDPSGRLLVSGHEDSSCVLYDIRGNRPIQCFKPHSSDIRSVRFSPSAYYLLSASYDNKLVLTDLQGDLTMPLPSVVVAQHSDKVISGRWHPSDFSFLSTSADKTAKLWALPPV
ncbi:CLUMA_CG009683, isoform B [Clunio marinus]|uniref:CLUMA_CG009683, isoform B n=1 Tax=Clunio marinus TaxID=568069 RepID=A0A1J1I954_9DIPT|nr:CLUMA_CG009683, isoform B [Clunio marinus]